MNAGSIDRKINGYLSVLSLAEKKAVLTVAKTFAASKQDDSEYSEEFKKELDSQYEDYLAGGPLFTQEDIDKDTQKIIKGKKRK